MSSLTARNTDVQTLFDMLGEQHARKVDVVLPATALHAIGGKVELTTGAEPTFDENGIVTIDGEYRPTDSFVGQLANSIKVSTRDLRRYAAERPDLFDPTVNLHLHGIQGHGSYPDVDADQRNFFFRGFAGSSSDGTENVARALLSPNYKVTDHLDVVTAILDGFREAGAPEMVITGADLSEKNMFMRFISPDVAVNASALLKGYRNPFGENGAERVGSGGWTVDSARAAAAAERLGFEPGQEPMIWAGFEVSNSETGHGSNSITPRAEFQICRNGLKIVADIDRKIHLGSRMDEGRIDWSADTREAELVVIRKRTRDAVKTFLDPAYWEAKVAELAAKADKPVKDADKVITVVSKTLGYTESERNSILSHFILGGQLSAGGVMNAITSAAQTLTDAERAADLEGTAVKALDLV